MTDISTVEAGNANVFCQISGRDISSESCSKTQGQEGCFGCAAHTRLCESCHTNFVVVAATGTCSQCTAASIEEEKTVKISAPPKKVECQLMKRPIGGSMCRSVQGQDGCRGCAATSRICETCGKHPVRFPQYGSCFTCSVAELGEGWEPGIQDRAASYPPLHVITETSSATKEKGREIVPLAQEFRRIPLANIRDPDDPVRTAKPDEEELFNLGDSMLSDGMIYPVLLEPVGENFFEVVIGSRRVRAARYREQLDIPALILEPQNALTRLLLALAENIQRVQLEPFEEGRNFLRLLREFGLSTSDIASKVNKPTAHVKERIQILSLPDDVKKMVMDGEISIRNAAMLARVSDNERQEALAIESATHRLASGELRRRVHAEIGVDGESTRVIPYNVTPEKFAARTEEFARWFKRAIPRLKLGETNLGERTLMIDALNVLEEKVRMIKSLIKHQKTSHRKKA